MHSPDYLHILGDILNMDRQNILGYMNKNQHHLILYIQHWSHMVKGCKGLQAHSQ